MSVDHAPFMQAAVEEARKGRAAGGIPIGSVLVIDGEIVGRGHNQRVQKGSTIRHAEMDCLEETGRRPAADYRRATLYSDAVAVRHVLGRGAALRHSARRRSARTARSRGRRSTFASRGVTVEVLDDADCVAMMEAFIIEEPTLWNEDIGE